MLILLPPILKTDTMRHTIFLFLFLFALSASMAGQGFVSRFAAQSPSGTYKTVHITQKMFRLAAESDEVKDEPKLRDILLHLDNLYVLRTKNSTSFYFSSVQKKLQLQNEFEPLVLIDDNSERVAIFIREEQEQVRELVLAVVAKGEFILIGMEGSLRLDQVAALSSSVKVDGMEYFKRIKVKTN